MSCVRFAVLGAWTAVCLLGCVSNYELPGPDEPHALVKIRRIYHTTPGPEFSETVTIDGHRVLSRAHDSGRASPAHRALRVHPEPGRWRVAAEFHHHEMRAVQEQYQERTPYTELEHYNESQSYPCGSSVSYAGGMRTCTRSVPRTRLVTKYRTQTKWRTVMRRVRVSDGSCSAQLAHRPQAGEVYLLQYTFVSSGACTLTCKKQTTDARGRVALQGC